MKLPGLFVLIFIAIIQELAAQTLQCTDNHVDDIYSFTIEANSSLGFLNLLYIQHDGARGHPFTSTAMYDAYNLVQNANRNDNFRRLDCDSVFDKQTLCHITFKTTVEQFNMSARTAWDRGHLTPVNPMRFSEDAQDRTFYCVNIAPQDPYTNQNPWATVESRTLTYLGSRAGFVMTGLCDLDNVYSQTAEGYPVPNCFWKSVCYVDDNGDTQVVSFIGNNTLLNFSNNEGKAQRAADTLRPRPQEAIFHLTNRDSAILSAWDGAAGYLVKNRDKTNNYPTAGDCRGARYLPDAVRDEWATFMMQGFEAHEFTVDTDIQAVKKLFYAGK